ncbi:hypothetical protein VdG2_08449 [Verticillium dahliae VDG2]|nr:hypothetical protein VdG2_08449 [Verticillium dahliae VDG2]
MSGNTTATLNFYAPPPDGAAPFNHVDPPPPGLPIRNYTTDSRPVPITDIRGSESSFQNLDRDAFALISGEPPSAETAFADDDSIKKNYYPELEALLLKAIPGANKVIFFDHTIRRASKDSPREPVQRVVPVEHRYANGYTGETAGIRYHEGQRWYYLSGMTGDQRLLLECFDSEALKEGSGVQGGRVAHTAFAHPGTAEDAEGRESIEVRALVFGP